MRGIFSLFCLEEKSPRKVGLLGFYELIPTILGTFRLVLVGNQGSFFSVTDGQDSPAGYPQPFQIFFGAVGPPVTQSQIVFGRPKVAGMPFDLNFLVRVPGQPGAEFLQIFLGLRGKAVIIEGELNPQAH